MSKVFHGNIQSAAPQGDPTDSGIITLNNTELLHLAEQISTGTFVIAEEAVAPLTKRFIDLLESPFVEPYTCRQTATKAAGILAKKYPEIALPPLLACAEKYASLQREEGACPYKPNGINALEEVPPCEEVIVFLMGLLEKYPGMAGPDVVSALKAIKAAP